MKASSFWPVKKNWATRLAALLLAVLVVVLLFWMVDRQVGNPIGCWYTEKKIAAHYNTYHPGERYVVAPAQFTFVDGKMRYVCHIYKQGSADTGFLAYFQAGAVLSTEAAETLSGNNTYNRFRLRLNEDARTQELQAQARKGTYPVDSLYADFFPGKREMVFDTEDPVFRVDAEYDREHLPLPTVLCAEFSPTQDGGPGDEKIAARLRYLKELAEDSGQRFDYYSLQWFDGSAYWTVLDVPSALIQPPSADGGEDALLQYLAKLPAPEKVGYFPQNSLSQQKSRLLYALESAFVPCTDHEVG